MIGLTQKFSATLATIADAAKRGDLSSEQAREMSAEQYQLTQMQFELLSLWRGIAYLFRPSLVAAFLQPSRLTFLRQEKL
jgi:hypothetical protein